MRKEKQIEELATELSKVNCKPSGCGFCYLEYGTLENSCEEYLVYKKMAQTLYNAGYRKQSELTPCDCCLYSPPSSGDGKPCSICPTQAKMRKEDEGK